VNNEWFVIYEDGLWGGLDNSNQIVSYSSRQEALKELFISQLEDRAFPTVKKLKKDFYSYTTSKRRETWITFYIATKEAILNSEHRYLFDEQ
jgi:hypothetical protein